MDNGEVPLLHLWGVIYLRVYFGFQLLLHKDEIHGERFQTQWSADVDR
jgi:hypothetical protein